MNTFWIEIFSNTDSVKVGENERLTGGLTSGVNVEVNEGLKSLLNFIRLHPGVQAKDCSKNLDRPIKTIERQIKELTDRGYIYREGSRKTGGYYAKK